MFTKEFIKISKVLDEYGLHRQADNLLKIAQLATDPKKFYGPTQTDTVKINPDDFVNYKSLVSTKTDLQNKINSLKKGDNTDKNVALSLATELTNSYKNNKIDYSSYKKLIQDLNSKAKANDYKIQDAVAIGPINPRAYPDPSTINETASQGRGRTQNPDGSFTDQNIPIQLASPFEGVTGKGETAFPNREYRNLPELQKDWNDYFTKPEFKNSIQQRIDEIQANDIKNNTKTDTSKLKALLDKSNSPDGLQVGDFGNAEETTVCDSTGKCEKVKYAPNNTLPTQIYGTESNPTFKPNR